MEKRGKKTRLLRKDQENTSTLDHAFAEACKRLDWMNDTYKQLFYQINDEEILSDVFVCAYDNIPLQDVYLALQSTDPHVALIDLRKKYTRKNYLQEKQEAANIPAGQPDQEDKANEIQKLLDEIMLPGRFNNDQIAYLLTCIEDGVEPGIIHSIAQPKYPVNVMAKLKEIKTRRLKNRQI